MKKRTQKRTMTQAEYADHAGVDSRTVRRWLKTGLINLTDDKKIDWVKADKARSVDPGNLTVGKMQALADPERDSVNNAVAEIPAGELPDILESKTRREYAEAIIAEMKAARMKGELVEVVALEKHLFLIFKSCRDALLNIPARISEKLAVLDNKTTIHAEITRELNAVLETLSNEITQCSNSVGTDAT